MKKFLFYIVLHICNRLLTGTHFFKVKRVVYGWAGIRVGRGTKIVGPVNLNSAATLKIGEGAWIGESLTIRGNGEVVIGNQTDLGPDVTFLTGTHTIGTSDRRAGVGLTQNFYVGDGSWIGAQTTILGGAHIGKSVVIAARSVVLRDCIENSLYAGVPASLKRSLSN